MMRQRPVKFRIDNNTDKLTYFITPPSTFGLPIMLCCRSDTFIKLFHFLSLVSYLRKKFTFRYRYPAKANESSVLRTLVPQSTCIIKVRKVHQLCCLFVLVLFVLIKHVFW